MNNAIPISGRVRYALSKKGVPLWVREGENLVVDGGKNAIAALLANNSPPARPSHFAVRS